MRVPKPRSPLPGECQAGPSADTTILESAGKSSIRYNVVADAGLGDEAHGIGAAEIAPVGGDSELLSGSATPLMAIAIAVPS